MNNKTILETVVEDIKDLRGKDVFIFGQPTTLKDELDELEIDVLDVLESLKEYEVTELSYENYSSVDDEYIEIEFETVHEYLEYLDNISAIDLDEPINRDNSYNWSSPVSNDLDFKIYETAWDTYLVECKVHRFGDVRTNYTDTFLLEFYDDVEFLEVLSESNIYGFIEVDGITYDVPIDIFSDVIEVMTEDGLYIGEVSAYDYDELKNEIRKLAS